MNIAKFILPIISLAGVIMNKPSIVIIPLLLLIEWIFIGEENVSNKKRKAD